MTISPEMERALAHSAKREDEFFQRHGIEDEGVKMARPTEAYKAWDHAVEKERSVSDGEGRVYLDTPLARKAFILGFRMAQSTLQPSATTRGENGTA